MANENVIGVDVLIKKRDNQLHIISSIVSDVNNLQQALEQRQQQLQLNQGALLQLNILLGELGVSAGELSVEDEVVNNNQVVEEELVSTTGVEQS